METSILIARLVGPVIAIAGIFALFNPDDLRTVAREMLASRALVMIAGIMALALGLAIVNTHNLWVADWRVLITVLGWLSIFAGIVRMGFPALIKTLGEKMLARNGVLRVSGFFQLAMGAVLIAMGYF